MFLTFINSHKFLIFSIAYIGILIWTFALGRQSVFDNWFNTVAYEKRYIDKDGTEYTEDEYTKLMSDMEAQEKTQLEDITFEEQMVALLALYDKVNASIIEMETENPGLTQIARKTLTKQYKKHGLNSETINKLEEPKLKV